MIGVIGGSGLASPTLLSEPRDTFTVTPYGAPSGPVVLAPSADHPRKPLLARARPARARASPTGVYVQAMGPRLETKAEIAFFKKLGDVVGMTVASEATLATELGIPYAALCSVDNYCHGLTPKPLAFTEIQAMQKQNSAASEAILGAALEAVG